MSRPYSEFSEVSIPFGNKLLRRALSVSRGEKIFGLFFDLMQSQVDFCTCYQKKVDTEGISVASMTENMIKARSEQTVFAVVRQNDSFKMFWTGEPEGSSARSSSG